MHDSARLRPGSAVKFTVNAVFEFRLAFLQGPVWVCTTNDALEDVVLHAVAPQQRQQLVFIQNGMLLPWLETHGLQHNTQVLLYMSGALQGARATSAD